MKAVLHTRMRIYHRYLGFFLAGIMAVYAISGIVLIFRDTNLFKQEKQISKQLDPQLSITDVGKAIRIKELKALQETDSTIFFKQGTYNKETGLVVHTVNSLPKMLERLTKLHKANTKSPLYYLNIFFGVSLLFFVLSSFWMFLPGSSILKKGLLFAAAGMLLTILLLWV